MKVLIAIILLFILNFSVFGDYADLVEQVLSTFEGFADHNTGLTVFPTLRIPMGGKMEGMGTAYTALASDAGFIEVNPAASSSLKFSEFTLYHHNWIADSNLEGVVYTFRLGDFGMGFGGKFLYVAFPEYNAWGEREAAAYYSESIGTLNFSYNFLSNYYFHGIAIGANLKFAYKHVPEIFYAGQSAIGLMADAGLLTRFDFLKFYSSRTKNLSIGLAVKNLGPMVQNEPLPTLLTAGIAYSFIRPVTLTVDYNLPISLDPDNFPAERWYLAFGLDLNFTSFLSFQAGFRLQENPRISAGFSLDLDDKSFTANYNLDLSGSVNPADKLSIEARIKLGYAQQIARQKKIDDLFALGLEAYAEGNFAQAILLWEEVLSLDPKFLVVRNYIETTQKYLELQKELEEKQNLYE